MCYCIDSGDEDNDELDKRMGEVDKGEEGEGEDEEEEELDRNLWAPEEEEEEQDVSRLHNYDFKINKMNEWITHH